MQMWTVPRVFKSEHFPLFLPPHVPPQAPELDQYYELSRREHECAYRIQRIYRRHVVWMRWHAHWAKRLAAIKIQALIRGVVTR